MLNVLIEAMLGATPDSTKVDTDEANSAQDEQLSRESIYVTNANREKYVQDYIYWLTHKSIEKQYKAFEKGFFACLDRKTLQVSIHLFM